MYLMRWAQLLGADLHGYLSELRTQYLGVRRVPCLREPFGVTAPVGESPASS